MTKKEKQSLIDWANSLSDEDLEKEYYKSAYDCLGSETEEMYERGYDMRDIQDREEYEDYLCEKSDILESICYQRGIKLWEHSSTEKGGT